MKITSLEQLKELKKHAGSLVTFIIEDREDKDEMNSESLWITDSSTATESEAAYPLENIYTGEEAYRENWIDKKRERARFFLVSSQQGKLLVPFKYSYSLDFTVCAFCTEEYKTVKQIRLQDNSKADIDWNISSRIFDGYMSFYDPNNRCKKNELEDLRYPLLKKQNCQYDSKLHAISGDIENLLKDCRALW